MRIDSSIIMKTLHKNNGQVRLTARELGISPGTITNWRKRSRTGSRSLRYQGTNLKHCSTKPHSNRITSLTEETQDILAVLRNKRGLGARKLKVLTGVPEHHNTIHRFLKNKGLTAPTKNYRRPRYQETTHMQVKNTHTPGKLQMDVKYVTPELSELVQLICMPSWISTVATSRESFCRH
jgi:transposase-like protein